MAATKKSNLIQSNLRGSNSALFYGTFHSQNISVNKNKKHKHIRAVNLLKIERIPFLLDQWQCG